ncbi:hypothetical protein A616_16555 [Brevibacillus brevis X23]|nr:hypothetical protein A616_16555 [Brevibacillus brevis X23]
MATKDVPNVQDCREWIQNILKCVKDIDLFTSYNLSVRDFERGYEDAELRRALKNLKNAYEEMKADMNKST